MYWTPAVTKKKCVAQSIHWGLKGLDAFWSAEEDAVDEGAGKGGGGVKWQLQGGVQLELATQAGWGQPLATVDFAIQLCKAMKGDQPNSQCGYFVSLQDEE